MHHLCLVSNSSCGGNVTGNIIDFPGDGKFYMSNLNCTWTIHRNYTFFLRFTRFDVFKSHKCQFDYLRIGGGRKLCGNSLPDDVYVNAGTTQLVFHSDSRGPGGHGVEVNIIPTGKIRLT